MKCADYFWLRSAGFPADALLQATRLPALPGFSDYMGLKFRRDQLQQRFSHHIATEGEEQCRKFSRKLLANQPLSASDLPTALRQPLTQQVEEWREINLGISSLEETVRPAFSTFSEQARQQLIDFLAQPDVSEAIFISNPDAAKRIRSLLADRNSANSSRKKQKIRLGWSYAQRFCTKNDTCSFFGPIAWGRFVEDQKNLVNVVSKPGPWIGQRETFFESWVLQRLVVQLNSECPAPQQLPLELNPGCHLRDEVLHYPLDKSRRLDGLTLELLQPITTTKAPCNGERMVQEFGAKCLPLIEHLITAGILRRGFQLSPRDPAAFDTLLQDMRAYGIPNEFRTKWSERFQALEAQREVYANGDLSQRQIALDAINQSLIDAGISLDRESGKMYVGRYPVYEDCAPTSSVSFSRAFQQEIESDFEPLMMLYRWLTRASAVLLHQAWLELYQTRQSEKGADSLSLLGFLQAIQGQKSDINQRVVNAVRTMLESAWQPLLDVRNSEELHLNSEHIEQVLKELYRLCPAARDFQVFGEGFHSPDFMVSAESTSALNQGDYWLVLGETHPGVHTLSQPVAAPFCPFTPEIERMVREIFGGDRLILADSPDSYQRSHIDWPMIDCYKQLILPSGGGCVAPSDRYPIGRAFVEVEDGRLNVKDIEGVFEEDLMCVCSTSLHELLFQLASDVLPHRDPRRIRVNRTIYKRRTWAYTLNANDWPKVDGDEFEIFVQWHCWKQQQGLPRWVFIKCDSEPKPLFVDFENPLSLDVLTTTLKKAKAIHVSEMLPAPNGLWLNDARGRVCCEVRTTLSTVK